MASLYEEYNGELHFYPNRKPQSNGAEPWLVWSWIQFFLAVIVLSVVCFMFRYKLFFQHPLKFILELSLLAFLTWRIVAKSVCVVFSEKKKQIWRKFLFFKWGIVPFREIADIRMRDQEFGGKVHFQFVATRKNKFQPPVKLSYSALETERISLVGHEAVPLLQEMFPGESADDVHVDPVEVPVAEAEQILQEAEAKRAGGTTARKTRLRYFTEKNKFYHISLRGLFRKAALLGALATLGATLLAFLQTGDTAAYVPLVMIAAIVGLLVATLPSLNTDFGIDTAGRVFRYRTKFGNKENEVPFNRLITFNMKEQCGILRLCLVLDGVDCDPNLCVTRSPDTIKSVYLEACSILNINPDRWFDG